MWDCPAVNLRTFPSAFFCIFPRASNKYSSLKLWLLDLLATCTACMQYTRMQGCRDDGMRDAGMRDARMPGCCSWLWRSAPGPRAIYQTLLLTLRTSCGKLRHCLARFLTNLRVPFFPPSSRLLGSSVAGYPCPFSECMSIAFLPHSSCMSSAARTYALHPWEMVGWQVGWTSRGRRTPG